MYYFKRTGIFSNNDPLTPIFCIIWPALKILTNHYFHPLFEACYQVQFKKNLTNKTERMYLFKKLGKILLNGKSIERKDRFVSKNKFGFSWMIKVQKRRTSDWKNWFHYIKWQKYKIRTHCCLQKLALF